MPEATMYEDHRLMLRQDDIGASGKIFSMKSEPIALLVQQAADDLFGGSVLPSNIRHNCAAFRGGEYVGHGGFQRYVSNRRVVRAAMPSAVRGKTRTERSAPSCQPITTTAEYPILIALAP